MRTMWRRRSNEATSAGAGVTVAPTLPPLDLHEIDAGVNVMFAHVPKRLDAASLAFLTGDREAARSLIETDPAIDALQSDIEELVQVELGRQPLSPDELRYLVTVLRIVPELERSADLVEHIALRAQHALADRLSPRASGLIEQMSGIAVGMWCDAAVAYRSRDAGAVVGLRTCDDQLDDLHVQLTSELSHDRLESSVAIELGLVARFFERLGDHAVNVIGRLGYLSASKAGVL
jgi:phosphate transport system protein